MSNLKEEIKRIVIETENTLTLILDGDHGEIIQSIRENFIQSNPRALWEGFKHEPIPVDTEGDYPHLKLSDLVAENELLYLIIDVSNEEYFIIQGYIRSIIYLIEDCSGLDEYYIVSNDMQRIICETDHDELLYIDLNSPKLRS